MTATSDAGVALPPDMALRYDRPAATLDGLVTGYHIYTAWGVQARGRTDWFLPGTANIRVALDAGPIAVTIGARTFSPAPAVALYGPTTHALRAETHGGVMIGIGLSALAWARLTRKSARDVADRIVPLADVLGAEIADTLHAALAGSDRDGGVAPILDRLLEGMLDRPHPDEGEIRAVLATLARNDHVNVERAAAEAGMTETRLRRIATQYFGLTSKSLLIRARFLRALLAVKIDHDGIGQAGRVEGYHDASHFMKDAAHILGMPPGRFLSLDTAFLDASLRARAIALGSPTQALHPIR